MDERISEGPEQPADSSHELPPSQEIPAVRWNVTRDEIMAATPEQLRVLLANMNEQNRRLYEIHITEIETAAPLTPEEKDLILHPEKAGIDDETASR